MALSPLSSVDIAGASLASEAQEEAGFNTAASRLQEESLADLEEEEEEEKNGVGGSGVARVPVSDQNPIFVDKSGCFDGAQGDEASSENARVSGAVEAKPDASNSGHEQRLKDEILEAEERELRAESSNLLWQSTKEDPIEDDAVLSEATTDSSGNVAGSVEEGADDGVPDEKYESSEESVDAARSSTRGVLHGKEVETKVDDGEVKRDGKSYSSCSDEENLQPDEANSSENHEQEKSLTDEILGAEDRETAVESSQLRSTKEEPIEVDVVPVKATDSLGAVAAKVDEDEKRGVTDEKDENMVERLVDSANGENEPAGGDQVKNYGGSDTSSSDEESLKPEEAIFNTIDEVVVGIAGGAPDNNVNVKLEDQDNKINNLEERCLALDARMEKADAAVDDKVDTSSDGSSEILGRKFRADDSSDKPDAAQNGLRVDMISSNIQEFDGENEPDQAADSFEANNDRSVPVLAADDSVQDGQSHPILVDIYKTMGAKEETLASSGVVEDNSSAQLPLSVVEPEVKEHGDDSYVCGHTQNINPNEAEEEEGRLISDPPVKVTNLESSEDAKESDEGSLSAIPHSRLEISKDTDGHIVSDSDEEAESDEENGEKEMLDPDALAALLRAASSSAHDGEISVTSQDANRIFMVDRPAGLGSSVPSLKPAPPRARPNLFTPELAVASVPDNDMTEEERVLHEKVELIKVKFLRLVHRLGHSPEDTVAAQVLYRLSLAEGIRHGRQTNRAFSLESAKRKALKLEDDGKEGLDFSCNILVVGKSGVGKSATINSIFGEEKSQTDAFQHATNSVKEIVGTVDGVKIRIIDTPGLSSSAMEQASNKKILLSIKKYTKRCPPDIVLYVDRMDSQTRDLNDLPVLRSITSILGSSIWFNAIVALTHAASAPPDGPSGSPLSYEVFVAQRSHVIQQSIRLAAGDMRLMNPVALVENHTSCRKNREGQRVLPNGLAWRPQMLLLCYSSKILSEANSLLKLQDPSPGKLFGFRFRPPPLPFLLSSLLQSRTHPKLATDLGGNAGDSDVDLDDLSDVEQEEEEDEYDQLPPFKPLRKSQIAKLTKEQRRAYFDEYDYRVKLLQKKQWKEELRRLKEMKKRGKGSQEDFAYGDMAEDFDQDNAPAAVPVPLPDMVLPPSFDCDSPTYRYRFLEPTSQLLARPVLDSHGWDHDCGYDGVSLEESLAVAGQFPAVISAQVTKDKKEFSIHLDSSISAKHGENGSSLAGFDIQAVGKQLAYILRGESKFKNFKRNKTTAGISITFLGETIATGLKLEDQLSIGKRVNVAVSTGAVRAQGDTAYGANLEARLRDKDFPIGQDLSTLGLSLMRWRGDLALGANLQSQLSVGRNSKVAARLALNNKLTGQFSIRFSSSEQIQIALLGIIPIAISSFRSIRSGESFTY